jgi:4'-phosphopantetheinyl transferase EntD
MSSLAGILPPGVALAEWTDTVEPPPLLPAEAALAASPSLGRRRELRASRACARLALARLGVAPAPVLRGPDREPIWPEGVVGSITHCPGYCAAAGARRGAVAAIGIDAEEHAPLPDGVLRKVALDGEREWLRGHRGDATCWDRLLFSAKESVFKAWFPLTRAWLGFHDAAVSFRPGSGAFSACLLVPGPVVAGGRLGTLEGRYVVADGRALTAVVVPAAG